jgi:ubiquinone/menaquinone biosynthesis C-methylase UbiE
MPFTDASFGVVYCQLGLQFFSDRPAALREMYRVLASEGRLGLMVWLDIERSPGFRVLANALGRHVGPEAEAVMRAPFGLAGLDQLDSLVADAGFRDIVIRPASGTVRFPSPTRFVQDYVAGSPLAGHVAKVSDEARAELASEVSQALQSYVTMGTLVFPIEAHLASARK